MKNNAAELIKSANIAPLLNRSMRMFFTISTYCVNLTSPGDEKDTRDSPINKRIKHRAINIPNILNASLNKVFLLFL